MNSLAVSLPMPELAPVMIATWSSNLYMHPYLVILLVPNLSVFLLFVNHFSPTVSLYLMIYDMKLVLNWPNNKLSVLTFGEGAPAWLWWRTALPSPSPFQSSFRSTQQIWSGNPIPKGGGGPSDFFIGYIFKLIYWLEIVEHLLKCSFSHWIDIFL